MRKQTNFIKHIVFNNSKAPATFVCFSDDVKEIELKFKKWCAIHNYSNRDVLKKSWK